MGIPTGAPRGDEVISKYTVKLSHDKEPHTDIKKYLLMTFFPNGKGETASNTKVDELKIACKKDSRLRSP